MSTPSVRHYRHYQHHHSVSYPVSWAQRFYTSFLAPTALVVILIFALDNLSGISATTLSADSLVPLSSILMAALATFVRLALSYIVAVVVAFPLALLIVRNHIAERFLLPIFDIVQSVPVLAFFPIVILGFLRYEAWDYAAIFIITLAMLWNLVFSLIGGLKSVPKDIESTAKVFHISGYPYFREVLIPASIPAFITGSLLAWAQGWNIIIVAEVLHVYTSASVHAPDLFGLGSLLVSASSSGNMTVFLEAIAIMIFIIAMMDFLVWQRLLHYSEKFKFD